MKLVILMYLLQCDRNERAFDLKSFFFKDQRSSDILQDSCGKVCVCFELKLPFTDTDMCSFHVPGMSIYSRKIVLMMTLHLYLLLMSTNHNIVKKLTI